MKLNKVEFIYSTFISQWKMPFSSEMVELSNIISKGGLLNEHQSGIRPVWLYFSLGTEWLSPVFLTGKCYCMKWHLFSLFIHRQHAGSCSWKILNKDHPEDEIREEVSSSLLTERTCLIRRGLWFNSCRCPCYWSDIVLGSFRVLIFFLHQQSSSPCLRTLRSIPVISFS